MLAHDSRKLYGYGADGEGGTEVGWGNRDGAMAAAVNMTARPVVFGIQPERSECGNHLKASCADSYSSLGATALYGAAPWGGFQVCLCDGLE